MNWKPVIAISLLASCGSVENAESPTVPADNPAAESTRPPNSMSETTSPDSGPPLDTSPPSEPSGDTEPPLGSTVPATLSDDSPTSVDRLRQSAANDLAERLGLAPEVVEIVDVEEVTWRDASLGCPQKDFSYAQVLTPGTRITLRADGINFEYHAGSGRDPFYCAAPEQPV